MSMAIRLDDIIKILEPDDKTLQSIMTLPWIEVPENNFMIRMNTALLSEKDTYRVLTDNFYPSDHFKLTGRYYNIWS